jgi:hypothetical protein
MFLTRHSNILDFHLRAKGPNFFDEEISTLELLWCAAANASNVNLARGVLGEHRSTSSPHLIAAANYLAGSLQHLARAFSLSRSLTHSLPALK